MMTSRRYWLVLLTPVCALTIATGTFTAPVLASNPEGQDDATATDVMSDALNEAKLYARTLDDVYAGGWVTESGVTIQFTNRANDDEVAKVLARVPDGVRVTVERVRWSEAELIDAYRQVRDDGMPGVGSVSVDYPENRIDITLDPDRYAGLRDQVVARYDDVTSDTTAAPLDRGTCTRYDCTGSPWKGGIDVNECTLSGVVFKGTSFRAMTAGHCSGVGSNDNRYDHVSSSHTIGYRTWQLATSHSRCDCQFISIDSGWDGHRYLKNDDDKQDIVWKKRQDHMNVGDTVCVSGKNNPNRRCGTVTDTLYSSYRTDLGFWIDDQILTTTDPLLGDSGAPEMSDSGQTVWGIQVAKHTSGGNDFSVISTVTGLEDRSDGWTFCQSDDNSSAC